MFSRSCCPSAVAMNKHSGGVKNYRASEGKFVLLPYKGAVTDTWGRPSSSPPRPQPRCPSWPAASARGARPQDIPKTFKSHAQAKEVLALFAKWLNDENGHILRLLVPFGHSLEKALWKKHSSLARGIMQKQWLEKQPKFQDWVTPALLGVYEGSSAKIASQWKQV